MEKDFKVSRTEISIRADIKMGLLKGSESTTGKMEPFIGDNSRKV